MSTVPTVNGSGRPESRKAISRDGHSHTESGQQNTMPGIQWETLTQRRADHQPRAAASDWEQGQDYREAGSKTGFHLGRTLRAR